MFSKTKAADVCVFLIFVLAAGMLKTFLPYDNLWDLVNYHYYNVWALFEGRLGYDIAPASLHTYFNPLLDIPFYLVLKNFNNYPSLVLFFQGMYAGILLFVFYKTVGLFFDIGKEKLSFIFTVLIGATGFAFVSQIGTTTNEIQTASLILIGVYLILKNIETQRSLWVWAAAGLAMGSALGLKPTCIIYCVAMGGVLILFSRRLNVSLREIAVFAGCGAVGYLSVNGYFMVRLYQEFDNPVFPFLNGLFKSAYFGDFNYRDERLLKIEFWKKLLFPFVMNSHARRYAGELYFFDIRLALAYTAVILSFLKWMVIDKCKTCVRGRWFLLYAFLTVSYVIWLNLFSIIRYVIVIEMLSAIVIVQFFGGFKIQNLWGRAVFLSGIVLGLFMLLSEVGTYATAWGGATITDRYVDLEQINLPENALVEVYGFPSAMPAAMIVGSGKNRIIGYANLDKDIPENFMETGKLRQLRDDIKKSHNGPVVALVEELWGNYYKRLNMFREKGMYCRPLHFNLWKIAICVPEHLKNQILSEEEKYGEKE